MMSDKPILKSRSSKQAVAILAVDNIKLTNFCLNLLKQTEEGSITHAQAKQAIFKKYRVLAAPVTK